MLEKNGISLTYKIMTNDQYNFKHCTSTIRKFYLKINHSKCCMYFHKDVNLFLEEAAEITGRDLPTGKLYTQSHAGVTLATCLATRHPHVTDRHSGKV